MHRLAAACQRRDSITAPSDVVAREPAIGNGDQQSCPAGTASGSLPAGVGASGGEEEECRRRDGKGAESGKSGEISHLCVSCLPVDSLTIHLSELFVNSNRPFPPKLRLLLGQ